MRSLLRPIYLLQRLGPFIYCKNSYCGAGQEQQTIKRTNHRRTIVEPTTANERHDNLPTPPHQTIMAPRGRQTGRIHPHQRQTDDTTTTIAGEGISAEHQANVFDTTQKGMTDKHRSEHRGRIRRFIKFVQKNYPTFYENCTRIITPEEKADPNKFYYEKDERDLIYAGFDPWYLLAFLGVAKVKANGKYCTPSNLSKFHNAIVWGAGRANQYLSLDYYTRVGDFLACHKKEFAVKKKEGKVDEKEADAICATLLELILGWSIQEGNVFVWVFTLLLWHLMARSINIDCLALHNMSKGESDSIVFIYDSTKMDQSGDFVQQKNCYSNPLPGREHCCLWLSLACWFAINQEKLTESEFFFVAAGSELKTASQNYARQVSEMAKRYEDQVRAHIRLNHLIDVLCFNDLYVLMI
jgi:hypothetical protein